VLTKTGEQILNQPEKPKNKTTAKQFLGTVGGGTLGMNLGGAVGKLYGKGVFKALGHFIPQAIGGFAGAAAGRRMGSTPKYLENHIV